MAYLKIAILRSERLRQRVIIVGIRSDLDREWVFPAETHSADRLFWDMYVTGEYWERHKICKLERPLIDRSIEAKKVRLILLKRKILTTG
jgi:DNA (cytosine-5)-methyltransferase 1